jgi:hypothetical protein
MKYKRKESVEPLPMPEGNTTYACIHFAVVADGGEKLEIHEYILLLCIPALSVVSELAIPTMLCS